MPEFLFHGLKIDQVKVMPRDDFIKLIPYRSRRALVRGLNHDQKHLLEDIRRDPKGFHRTKSRETVILPEMLGIRISEARVKCALLPLAVLLKALNKK